MELEPEYEVFLSHSGSQKEFVQGLYDDLTKLHVYPFFDKCSLPRAEKFAELIKQAAEQCRVAVVVLSEEFLTTKWPMLELHWFLEAKKEKNPRLRIFPMFYKISCADLKDESKLEGWRDAWWKAVGGDERIKKDSWETAVKELPRWNGEEFKQALMSEKQYSEKVAREICKLATPNLRFDDSKIRGADRLCQVIVEKFGCPPPQNSVAPPLPLLVGLYGMGGAGKTTLCRMLCNRFSKDFPAKVFHIQLESFRSGGDESLLERQKKILRALTDETANLVDRLTDPEQGWPMLKRHMHKHHVFLALDNVWENSEEEAKRYLEVGFSSESRVLVTSRSRELLLRLLGRDDLCMAVPDLNKEEAIRIFLEAARRGLEVPNNFTDEQMRVVEDCMERCHRERSTDDRHYHPLALGAMGGLLKGKSEDPLQWKVHLERWQTRKYGNPVFDVIGTSYEDLDCKTKQIFLDVAVFAPRTGDPGLSSLLDWKRYLYSSGFSKDPEWKLDLCSWLKAVHRVGKDDHDIEDRLSTLKNRMILEGRADGSFSMHDLYLEFAKMKAREGEFGDANLCFYREGADEVGVQDFKGNSSLLRVGLPHGGFRRLDRQQLQECSWLRVLSLDGCRRLKRLDVAGLESLRSLDLLNCGELSEVRGMRSVEKQLAWLRLDYCFSLRHLVADGKFQILSSSPRLPALEFLSAYRSMHLTKVPDLRISSCLQILSLRGCTHLKESPAVDTLTALRILDLSGCSKLRKLRDMSQFSSLEELRLRGCSRLREVRGVDELVGLKSLDLRLCYSLRVLPRLSGLTNLQELKIEDTEMSGCNADQVFSNLTSFTALTSLEIRSFLGLTELPNISLLCLEELEIMNCRNLRGLAHLGPFPALRKLWLSECGHVEEMPDLSESFRMRSIHLEDIGISYLPSYLTALTDLEVFKSRSCKKLATSQSLGLLILTMSIRPGAAAALAKGLAGSIADEYACDADDEGVSSFERDLAELGSAQIMSCLQSLFEHGMEDEAIRILESACWKRNKPEPKPKPRLTVLDKLQNRMMKKCSSIPSSMTPEWKPTRWEPSSVGVKFIGGEEGTHVLAKCMEIPTSFLVINAVIESGKHEEELSKYGFTKCLMQHISNQPFSASHNSSMMRRYYGGTFGRTVLVGWSELLIITFQFSTQLWKELKAMGAHQLLNEKIIEIKRDLGSGPELWDEQRIEVLNALYRSAKCLLSWGDPCVWGKIFPV